MKIVSRNMVHGYFLTDPARPKLLRGVEYNQAHECGIVTWQGEQKSLVCIPFSPDLYTDTKGEHQESFDMSGSEGDRTAAELFPLLMAEQPDLSGFAPSARERVLASLADGMSVFDAAMTHLARLIPEYCGATFQEVIEYRPRLLMINKDEDGNESQNINRCSLE